MEVASDDVVFWDHAVHVQDERANHAEASRLGARREADGSGPNSEHEPTLGMRESRHSESLRVHVISSLGWRTRQQLLIMYNNDTALVDAICNAKLAAGLVKPHPDLPDDESALLYYDSCPYSMCIVLSCSWCCMELPACLGCAGDEAHLSGRGS